jgi:hypothetical protein
MLSLQRSSASGDVNSGLVAIENSSPEVIHVVSVSGAQQRTHPVAAAVNSALSNMQTITISAGSLNFPLNLVCVTPFTSLMASIMLQSFKQYSNENRQRE